MSGQASQSRRRHLARRREVLARLLARSMPLVDRDGRPAGSHEMIRGDVVHFDVHAARELARSLIALQAEQSIFEDWTRTRGMHYERRTDAWCWAYTIRHRDLLVSDGWEVGAWTWIGGVKLWPMVLRPVADGWPGKLARFWPGDARAPMGRTLAKLGRDLLAALEGQPSECKHPACVDGKHPQGYSEHAWPTCLDCRGTGHNLRGFLPPIVATPAVRRRRADQGLDEDGVRTGDDTWLDDPAIVGNMAPGWGLFSLQRADGPRVHSREDLAAGANGATTRTRVVVRGKHRAHHDKWPECEQWDCSLDIRINGRGWLPRASSFEWRAAASPWKTAQETMPRWRRGEIKHERKRQRQSARRPVADLLPPIETQAIPSPRDSEADNLASQIAASTPLTVAMVRERAREVAQIVQTSEVEVLRAMLRAGSADLPQGESRAEVLSPVLDPQPDDLPEPPRSRPIGHRLSRRLRRR